MDYQIIPPAKVPVLEAATAGILLALLFQTQLTWRLILTIIVAGEIVAYFLTDPLAAWFKLAAVWQGPIGLGLGLSAMYLLGGLFLVLGQFRADPFAVLKRFRSWLPGGGKTE